MIRISHLLKSLEDIKAKHGDLVVFTKFEGMGGYALSLAEGPTDDDDVFEVHPSCFEDEPDAHIVKELWPEKEWDGELESLDNFPPVTGVVIEMGSTLYTT